MCNPSFYQKALRGFFAVACLSAASLSAVDIPGSAKVSGPVANPDGFLNGEYWQRPPVSILTDGRNNPEQRIDVQIRNFGPPTGTFEARTFLYLGNDLTAVPAYLAGDAGTFSGTPGNMDDGALRFTGFINVAAPGIINLGVTSDDGSRITIAGIDIAERDGSHGDETQDMDANFAEAGLYPIEITYFNGDWTDAAAAGCSSDHDPSPSCTAHGGANFHLRVGGVDITPAQVATLFQSHLPVELANVVNIGGNKVGTVTPNGEGSYSFVAGGNDIWAGRDEFTYAYTEVTGNFDVQVRVESVEPNARWSKAGIMARESLSEFSRMAFPRVTPLPVATGNGGDGANDTRFAYRTGIDNTNGISGGEHEDCTDCENQRPSNGHNWVRLTRVGDVLTAYSGTDGITWTQLGTQDTTIWGGGPLAKTLFVGLGASRHSPGGESADVEFRDFGFNYDPVSDFNVTGASSRGDPISIHVTFDKPLGNGAFEAGNYTLTTVNGPNVTIVTGLRFTTANDAPERDPMTFTLEGAYTADGPWVLIASGNTGLSTDRFSTAPDVTFPNATPYSHYRLLFPTVRDAAAANSMQIGEVEFLDELGVDVTAPTDPVIGVVAVAGNDYSAVAVVGTAGGQNNYPAAEHPALTIDGPNTTKYLNFAELNTGIIVSPAGGVPAEATVTAAAGGPGNSVKLTVTPLVEGAEYMVDVNGVDAEDGGLLVNTSASFVHGAGYEAKRIHISHNKTDDSGYYQNSDAVAKGIGDVVHTGGGVFPPYLSNTLFEDPTPDAGNIERFSTRISGILNVTTAGDHTFAVSSDDISRLYLSTDAEPANKVQIAMEPEWNASRQYLATDRRPAQENISTPQNLAVGQYYLEFIVTEGGGGNNGSATWQPPGGAAIMNGSSPIPESAFLPSRFYGGETFRTLGPVQIVQQPASQTQLALLPVTFTVGADGTPTAQGYRYQWHRDGEPIPGANGRTYTIEAASLSDDGAVFSVVVENEFSSVTSAGATLTVQNPMPPHLVGASAGVTFTTVNVDFDNRVLPASAEVPDNYTITGGSGPVTVMGATRSANGRRVVLTTSQLEEGTTYSLSVKDINDETGTTTIEPNPSETEFRTLRFAPGYVLRQHNKQFSGTAVDAFVTAQRNGTAVYTAECLITTWEYNQADEDDNYGGRISGIFVPKESGPHIFYIASDDPGRLFLSTDADPANLTQIAREPGWANRRAWIGGDGDGTGTGRGTPQVNISAPIELVAGQRYYMESYHTEGGGGDHQAVAVQGPSDPVPVNGMNVMDASFFGTYIDAAPLVINAHPMDQTVTENGFATFTVDAVSESSLCGGGTRFQWYRDDIAIPGANGASYTVGPATLDDNGAVFHVVITSPGQSATSDPATLMVVVDDVAPRLLSATADSTFSIIKLTFDELLDPDIAGDIVNWTVTDASMNILTVLSATVDGTMVILTTDPQTPGTIYTVDASIMTDLKGNPIDPAFSMADFSSFVISCGFVRFDFFRGVGGTDINTVNDLLNHPSYPNSPTHGFFSGVTDWPQPQPTVGSNDNYGLRMRGYYVAQVDGDHQFYVHNDDAVLFRLSLNSSFANLVDIGTVPCCQGALFAVGVPQTLVAGQLYAFELIGKEVGGGDHWGLGVLKPGDAAPTFITGSALATPADPTGASIAIDTQPADQTFIITGGVSPLFANDFNTDNGGFTVDTPQAYDGPWVYNAGTGSWQQDGQVADNGHPNTSMLNSPVINVTAPGHVLLTFDHRYSFEADFWDGGQVRVSVNGGPFQTVPGTAFTQNGYPGSVTSSSSSVLTGQEGFVLESPNYAGGTITSIADLGAFLVGDTVQVQFIAGNDTNTRGPQVPNWEIDSVEFVQGAGPATVTFSVAATGVTASDPNPPIFYQWYRDDGSGFLPISGANSADYTFAPTSEDDGALFRVDIYIPGAQATSETAELTVVGGVGPAVSVARLENGDVVVSWTGEGCLQETAELLGAGTVWTPSAVENGVPFTPTGDQRFFGLGPCP